MEALENILGRRSIRRYTEEPIASSTIDSLLKAAMSAPSASNIQPWQFVVITERNILDAFPSFHPHAPMMPQAAAAIMVCGEPERSRYWQQDCGAATQNILLAARALGLGAVWLGIYPREDRVNGSRALLGIPEPVVPMALVALGYPAEQKAPSERFDEAKLHHQKW